MMFQNTNIYGVLTIGITFPIVQMGKLRFKEVKLEAGLLSVGGR